MLPGRKSGQGGITRFRLGRACAGEGVEKQDEGQRTWRQAHLQVAPAEEEMRLWEAFVQKEAGLDLWSRLAAQQKEAGLDLLCS